MEDPIHMEESKIEVAGTPSAPEATPAPPSATERKRPRLNLGAMLGGDRKRGRGMLGLALGTLNKAKLEDKERNASEAAKKRQLIEKRLQMKLKKETDSVRRAEEAKRDKMQAIRKEEDLQLKDSIYKLRRTRLPILANFLITSDVIPSEPHDSDSPPPKDVLSGPPRSHPPPLYYLPAILTSEQKEFLERRKAEVAQAAQDEWEAFKKDREAGIEEVNKLRQAAADAEAQKAAQANGDADAAMDDDSAPPPEPVAAADPAQAAARSGSPSPPAAPPAPEKADAGADMDVDDGAKPESGPAKATPEKEKKEDAVAPMQDEDDAVEY